MAMNDDRLRFFDEDGEEIDPSLIAKPGLCVSCVKDDDRSEEPLLALIRMDEEGEGEFRCDAYERRRD